MDKTKYLEANIEKAADGSFIAIASTNAVDRHGEIVDNNGWDLKAFKKNPVILWAHDHNEPAIGVSKKTWVEGTGKKAQLMIQPLIHDITDKARAVKALIEMGIIKTLSVGFIPTESPDGTTFTKNELLEVSMVNVPANAEAMMLAYKGLKSKGFEEEVIEQVGVQTEWTAKFVDLEKSIEDLKGELDLVKAAPVNPKRPAEVRLSMLKVVARASDKLLEAEKRGSKVDRTQLAKAIKRATELMTVAEKENLHG
jgi:HK97 family phage prohead protease